MKLVRPSVICAMATLGVLALLSGCEHLALEDPDPPDEATLSAVQATIFNQSCALSGCHVGSQAPMGLRLEEGQAYDNLVGVPSVQVPDLFRVEPGNPDLSYLVMKVEGAEGIIGSQMPLGVPPLTEGQIELIREWIAAGAHDD